MPQTKPLPPFGDFLAEILKPNFYRPAVRPEPGTRIQFPSPCESEGHNACTGEHCQCECHLLENAEEDFGQKPEGL